MVSQMGESFGEPQGVEHFAKDSTFRDSSQICGQTDGKCNCFCMGVGFGVR